MPTDPDAHSPPGNDGPPFFKTWNGAYLFVLGWLAVLVVTFTVLTRIYE